MLLHTTKIDESSWTTEEMPTSDLMRLASHAATLSILRQTAQLADLYGARQCCNLPCGTRRQPVEVCLGCLNLPRGTLPRRCESNEIPCCRRDTGQAALPYTEKVKLCLKGLSHSQKCLDLFSDSEAYHEQMGPIPSSNGSLDIALSNAHT